MHLFRNWLAALLLTTAAVCTVAAAGTLRLEVVPVGRVYAYDPGKQAMEPASGWIKV